MTAMAETTDRDPRAPAGLPGTARSPLRRCLASGAVRPRAQLLRFVIGPDGVLVFDLAGKLPGRGLWLAPERDLLAFAPVFEEDCLACVTKQRRALICEAEEVSLLAGPGRGLS